jgi:hypothetical protein
MHTDAVAVHSSPGHVIYLVLPADAAFEAAYRRHCLQHEQPR